MEISDMKHVKVHRKAGKLSLSSHHYEHSTHEEDGKKSDEAVLVVVKHQEAWILGTKYTLDEAGKALLAQHAQSFFRLTYRKDFPALSPYSTTSDAGWGCMIRAAQMMMAHALQRHLLGKDWRLPSTNTAQVLASNENYCKIVSWFLDHPGAPHFLSLPHMVQGGMAYDKLPGEWWGPNTACLVLRDLCHMHRLSYQGPLAVHVTQSEVVYTSEVEKLCANLSLNDCLLGLTQSPLMGEQAPLFHPHPRAKAPLSIEPSLSPTSNARADPLSDHINTSTNNKHSEKHSEKRAYTENKRDYRDQKRVSEESFFDPLFHQPPSFTHPWTTSLLLLLPLRLGIDKVNAEYREEIKEVLQLKWSVGIIGGRPHHAIYFTGYNASLDTLYGLDPHTIFPTLSPPVEVSTLSTLLSQIHTPSFTSLSLGDLDPSLALGFYCVSREDFDEFCVEMKRRAGRLVCVQHTPPSYILDDEYDEGEEGGKGMPAWMKTILEERDGGIGTGKDSQGGNKGTNKQGGNKQGSNKQGSRKEKRSAIRYESDEDDDYVLVG